MEWVTQSKGDLHACLRRMAQGVTLRNTLLGITPADQPDYVRSLLDAVEYFEQRSIPYALVGGLAAMFYGRPRFTEDIDFVAITPPSDFAEKFDECGVDIRIWKDDHTDAIVQGAHAVQISTRTVRIANPHDLIAMKLRVGRIRDDYDISEILKGTAVNDDIVKSITTPTEFTRYLEIKRRTLTPIPSPTPSSPLPSCTRSPGS